MSQWIQMLERLITLVILVVSVGLHVYSWICVVRSLKN